MMTSLSEQRDANEMLPPSLLSETAGRGAEVTRLQFATLEIQGQSVIFAEEAGVAKEPVERHAEASEDAAERRAQFELQRTGEQIELAHQRGWAMGREEVLAETELRIKTERTLVTKTCAEFRRERDAYFSAVEAEVVKLALAIAARILHREAKLDPMLLRGVVKVALEKVMEESGTVLRVPPPDIAAWEEIARQDGSMELEISGDPKLAAGECVLETRVGRVELGVGAQLEEIEKGFFDLLQQRPS
jgi:flagellar assembly protein FliH